MFHFSGMVDNGPSNFETTPYKKPVSYSIGGCMIVMAKTPEEGAL